MRILLGAADLDLPGAGDARAAVKRIDLVLLEQERDAFDVARDAFVLEFHHCGEIELRGRKHDAHFLERVPGFLEQLGGVQQRFRRDAALEGADASGIGLDVDQRDLHAEVCGMKRGCVAAWAAADDG